MEDPFEKGYFEWQRRAEEKGYKVVTKMRREAKTRRELMKDTSLRFPGMRIVMVKFRQR